MSIHDYPLLPGFPIPSDRDSLQHEIHELEKDYHEKYLNDAEFHARSRMIGNLLEQLASVGEDGDRQRTGFLVAALMDRHLPAKDKLLLEIDSMLSEHYVTLYGTSSKMLEDGPLPKSQRPEDYDHEATMRYTAYAAQARTIMMMVRKKISGRA